jgi:hypothetical protein
MTEIGYEEFGRRLVEEIITADRVRETLEATVAGDFDTEVKIAGGIVRASGKGSVWRIDVDRIEDADDDHVTYRAYLHTDLDMTVRVGGVPQRYTGKAMIELLLRALIRADLSIFIDVPPVRFEDVTLELTPAGVVAGVLDQIGGVSDQVQREIVRFANKRKDEKAAMDARLLDLGPTIEAEWERRRTAENTGG